MRYITGNIIHGVGFAAPVQQFTAIAAKPTSTISKLLYCTYYYYVLYIAKKKKRVFKFG